MALVALCTSRTILTASGLLLTLPDCACREPPGAPAAAGVGRVAGCVGAGSAASGAEVAAAVGVADGALAGAVAAEALVAGALADALAEAVTEVSGVAATSPASSGRVSS